MIFFKGLSYHTRSIFIRSEISWNSYFSGVLVTLGEKIVTCVIFLVRTWFTIPFHAKIVHFLKNLLLDYRYFFPSQHETCKSAIKTLSPELWSLLGFVHLFVCLFLSASVISIRTQILVISKPELNEERKKILYF